MTTEQDELVTRVTSYVAHQAAKEPGAIKEVIQKGQDQLLGLIDGLSEGQAAFKPGPDDWSVLEVLQHLIESKRGVARRCVLLARGETPAPLGAIGTIDREPPASLAQARSALEAAHGESLAFADSISPATNLEARFEHPMFGPLNCREWAVFQRVHDGDHALQIQQIKASPRFSSGEPPTPS